LTKDIKEAGLNQGSLGVHAANNMKGAYKMIETNNDDERWISISKACNDYGLERRALIKFLQYNHEIKRRYRYAHSKRRRLYTAIETNSFDRFLSRHSLLYFDPEIFGNQTDRIAQRQSDCMHYDSCLEKAFKSGNDTNFCFGCQNYSRIGDDERFEWIGHTQSENVFDLMRW
jgi:hypothetical protein